ncbi:MAG: 50S ribosomal protein L18 [Leptolyngbyaceae bacterium]|nr:50S ribosomal protein L18 [Leptolyngbyaceae bacterium]
MKRNRKDSTRRRHRRIRRKIFGTTEKPRLSVFRSNENIYAQLIDDTCHSTLVAASTVEADIKKEVSKGNTCEASIQVGKLLAQRSLAKGIKQVVFDRGGNLYHGRVKALADAAREEGLNF